ncbi:Polysaccharide biosynthesis/export protein [Rubripirellula lacrimiformis]|uniref:Polysaccharide biosynthesis/export protein n=1 Tax=Rubripirellula lacrimiformis TaxID=1930273 RepID=A0A517NGL0_9BACT|nr:polysaccharide biosynthesis/export family protein [Rubripirellula lacrimiformis]QDT06261.1 Polysaccharide biosynthesis/export protein [Rubripirellula lacrimiformis]
MGELKGPSWSFGVALCGGCLLLCGCSSLTFPIKGTPASSISPSLRPERKSDLVRIDISRLSQPSPTAYRLDEGDVIGLFVETVLPFRKASEPPIAPPVVFPDASILRPAIGTPLAVASGGIITVPGAGLVSVKGLTFDEAAARIHAAYISRQMLDADSEVPSVTLISPRQIQVLVVREDTGGDGGGALRGNDREASGGPVLLEAYKNDVLNALMATGGLPGLRAKNEVRIYRRRTVEQSHLVTMDDLEITGMLYADGSSGHTSFQPSSDEWIDGPDKIIPLRKRRGEMIQLTAEDVILEEGDIVYVSNRDTEVFYTAGLLPPGEHLLPRDYDIDVFEAMSIAGYSYGASGSGGGLIGSVTVPPTQLFIFRDLGGGRETTIEVDLGTAIHCHSERLLIRPGDKLLLRHSRCEESTNLGMFTFFTYGLQQLFRN